MGAPFRLLCNAPSIYPSPSQNIPPTFSTTMYDAFKIYPPPSQNITLFLRDPHIIYPSLPESTPLFYNCMQQSHNLPLPPRIYPPPLLQLYATLPESAPPSHNILLFLLLNVTLPESTPQSQTIPHPFFHHYYVIFPESTAPSQKKTFSTTPFSTTFCNAPII